MKKTLKIFAFILLSIFSFNCFAYTFKEPGVLTVCSYSEFKPITYGKGQGYEADLLKSIAILWHVKIKFYSESIYEGLWRFPSRNYARCDVAIGGFTPANYRIKQGAAFSIVTTTFAQSLLVRKADYVSKKITSYDSFKNTTMKIGVVPGTTGEKYAYQRGQQSHLPMSNFVQYESEAQLLPALLSKKIDAIARGEIGNEYQELLDPNLVTIAKQDFNEGFAFAVDSSNLELISALNQAILKITHHGQVTYHQWLKNPNIFYSRAYHLIDCGHKHNCPDEELGLNQVV